jgi:hypothetical protein
VRQESMAAGPARLGPLCDRTASYRPVLSSERAPYIKKQVIVRVKKKHEQIWSWALREKPTPRQTGRLTVGRNINDDKDDDREKHRVGRAISYRPWDLNCQRTPACV